MGIGPVLRRLHVQMRDPETDTPTEQLLGSV